MDLHDFFYDFLNKHPLAVISTIHPDGTPQAAVVGFGQTKELRILIGTDNSSRKYRNLKNNPHAALVIGWDDSETVQYEGTARELMPNELDIVRNNYWVKNPDAQVYSTEPGERYFIITPTWIRYTNLATEPWETKELQF